MLLFWVVCRICVWRDWGKVDIKNTNPSYSINNYCKIKITTTNYSAFSQLIHQQRSSLYSTSKLDDLHPQITPYTTTNIHHQQQQLATTQVKPSGHIINLWLCKVHAAALVQIKHEKIFSQIFWFLYRL